MITVYADLLFAVNFFMDLLLIKMTSLLIRKKIKKFRTALAAVIGSLPAAFVFFANLSFFTSVITNVIISAAMVFTAFGFDSKKAFLRTFLVFYTVTFLCGGVIFLLFMNGKAFISNGSVYFDESVRTLIFGAAAAYYVVKVLSVFIKKVRQQYASYAKVNMYLGKNSVSFTAITDTGNILTEPLSGLPVCIVQKKIFDNLIKNETPPLRLIPYKTIDKPCGAMLGFKPRRTVINDREGKKIECECFVAATNIKINSEADGLISPLMISRENAAEERI